MSLLISILLPALGKARDTSYRMIGASNQRQLMIATTMYQVDFKGYFPRSSETNFLLADGSNSSGRQEGSALWFNALDIYLSLPVKDYQSGDSLERNYADIKQDPAWTRDIDPIYRQDNRTTKMNNSFQFNDLANSVEGFRRDTDVLEPGNTVVFVDGRAVDTKPATGSSTASQFKWFNATPRYVGIRHDDGCNVAFADGHVTLWVQEVDITGAGYTRWYLEGTGLQELEWDLDPATN